jgi:hypothetical protein
MEKPRRFGKEIVAAVRRRWTLFHKKRKGATMDEHDPPPADPRSSLLTVLLTLLAGSLFLVVLFITCGGFIVYIGAVVGGIAVIGVIHYLLWGHSLTEAVADEREQEKVSDPLADDDWPEERFSSRRL